MNVSRSLLSVHRLCHLLLVGRIFVIFPLFIGVLILFRYNMDSRGFDVRRDWAWDDDVTTAVLGIFAPVALVFNWYSGRSGKVIVPCSRAVWCCIVQNVIVNGLSSKLLLFDTAALNPGSVIRGCGCRRVFLPVLMSLIIALSAFVVASAF